MKYRRNGEKKKNGKAAIINVNQTSLRSRLDKGRTEQPTGQWSRVETHKQGDKTAVVETIIRISTKLYIIQFADFS